MGLLIALSSCGAGKVTITDAGIQELSESQSSEYRYALTEATKQKLFGNFPQAVALYKKCIEVNPGSDVAYFQMASIMMMVRDYDKAQHMSLKANSLNKNNYWYKTQLAELYLLRQKNDSALIVYQEMNALWPGNIELSYDLARLYAENKKYEKALEILEELQEQNGVSELLSLLIMQIYESSGKPEKAVEELVMLMELNPEEIKYLGFLAELYNSMGKNKEALDAYEKIFEREPENGMAQLSIAEYYRTLNDFEKEFQYLEIAFKNPTIELNRKMAVMIDFLTNPEEIKMHSKNILVLIDILQKEYPEDSRIRSLLADYYVKTEQFDLARAEFDTILSVDKNNYFIWEQAVFVENFSENYEEVIRKSEEAIKYFPDKALLYLLKANAAVRLEKYDMATRSLTSGLKYVENNNTLLSQFYSMMAENYHNQKDYANSDKFFELAIQLEPDNVMVLNNYSYYLAIRGEKLEEAEKMSKRTIKEEPDNSTYLDTYAWILFKAGKLDRALEYIKKAYDSGGREDGDILEHYGDILHAAGMKEEAAVYWIKAREAGNKNKELERKIPGGNPDE